MRHEPYLTHISMADWRCGEITIAGTDGRRSEIPEACCATLTFLAFSDKTAEPGGAQSLTESSLPLTILLKYELTWSE
jgi:hypothetical protein